MKFQKKIIHTVDLLKNDLFELSKELHSNPELSFHEHYAVKRLTSFLSAHKFSIQKGICGLKTAFEATLKGNGKPVITFISEYDALPEIGHACGHNLISAASLGAACALAHITGNLKGTIKVIGTPAEEKGGGKILLLERGAFDDTHIALMTHPSSRTIISNKMLGLKSMRVRFLGKSSHAAASPQKGINALDAAIIAFNNINALRSKIRGDARINGIITEGGEAPNIIPERASIWFYIRALDMDYLNYLVGEVKRCIRSASITVGCRYSTKLDTIEYEPFKPNMKLAEIYRKHLTNLGTKEDKLTDDYIGSSDMGNLSQRFPVIHPQISITGGQDIANHTRGFTKAAISKAGERFIVVAAKTMALTALEILLNPALYREISEEFGAA